MSQRDRSLFSSLWAYEASALNILHLQKTDWCTQQSEIKKRRKKSLIKLTPHMVALHYSPFLLAGWTSGAGLIVFVLCVACDPKVDHEPIANRF